MNVNIKFEESEDSTVSFGWVIFYILICAALLRYILFG